MSEDLKTTTIRIHRNFIQFALQIFNEDPNVCKKLNDICNKSDIEISIFSYYIKIFVQQLLQHCPSLKEWCIHHSGKINEEAENYWNRGQCAIGFNLILINLILLTLDNVSFNMEDISKNNGEQIHENFKKKFKSLEEFIKFFSYIQYFIETALNSE